MSGYFEDLRELQHAIDGTDFEVEQHNGRNESIERENRRQRKEMQKIAAKYEIDRWNARDKEPSVPESDFKPVKDETAPLDQSEGQDGASSAPGDVEQQDARLLPAWARKILAVADQIELENEYLKQHKVDRGRLDQDGQGHQQYLATQQQLQIIQMESHWRHPKDRRSDMRDGNHEDPQVLHRQQDEQFEEVESPVSSAGSDHTVVPWISAQSNDEEDGAANHPKERARRRGKGKASNGDVQTQGILASDGIIGTRIVNGAAGREVTEEAEIDQPMLLTEDRPNAVRHQKVIARASPTGLDRAQSKKLERKQHQKAAAELKRKQRQEKRQEAKRQKMIEEQRAEEERKKDDERFWQWLRERQLANPNATVASLSREQYLREAKQKKKQDVREARRKKQREEGAALQTISN